MDLNTLQNSDYLDILFEGRNKQYGSYELRRNYPKRVKSALLILAGIALAVAAYGMAGRAPLKLEKRIPIAFIPITLDPPSIDPDKPKPLPPPAAPVPPASTIKFTTPVIEKDKEVQETDRPPEAKELKEAVAGSKTEIGTGEALSSAPDLVKTGGNGIRVTETRADKNLEIPLCVEQMPEFNGDVNAYLANNIVYPSSARDAGVDGRVVIKFVISEDGAVTGAVVEKGVNGALDAEALRVVRSMPKWKPGKQNGKAVKVYLRVPVRFKLD